MAIITRWSCKRGGRKVWFHCISNLTRLTAVVCMKVRFEAKINHRFFSLASSLSRLVVAASRLALDLFGEEKSRKTSGTRVGEEMLRTKIVSTILKENLDQNVLRPFVIWHIPSIN